MALRSRNTDHEPCLTMVPAISSGSPFPAPRPACALVALPEQSAPHEFEAQPIGRDRKADGLLARTTNAGDLDGVTVRVSPSGLLRVANADEAAALHVDHVGHQRHEGCDVGFK